MNKKETKKFLKNTREENNFEDFNMNRKGICIRYIYRTDKEMENKIKELISNTDNFSEVEEGLRGWEFDVFNPDKAKETLNNFVNWLKGD